ncbi:hypothetical protein, partial [Tardiphaga sp.]|uniref:hypothetical protein n=1 Tax=Tardiphaga sp. TaxID=1926292 RepID=UPI0025E78510
DDETRLGVLALVATVAQEFLNAFGHSTLQTAQRRDTFKNDLGSKRFGHITRWRREGAKKLRPNCAAVDWLGVIPPAHLAMKDKPLRYSRRLVESRQRPKKPDPSLL